MHQWSIVLTLAFYVYGANSVTRYISHVQNYVSLVSSYYSHGYSIVDVPPISNVSDAMRVNADVSLFAINGFDEVAGNIELVAALNMSWIDQMPLIKTLTFTIQDRESFLVPYEMIWTPKLVLTNAIGDTTEVGDPAYLCRFNMRTNEVVWRPRVIISGACTPDITYYPFDKQTCSFKYTSWGFSAQELVLENKKSAWDTSGYQESGEWEIDTTETEAYIEDNQSYLLLSITIIRKPLYFAFNIVIPVLVLCLLNGTVFLLPAESGERVGFSVTCFLSFVVLLNMIMDILPRSSNPISFLCYYLVVMMCCSGAMTLVTILLMRVYHKPQKSKVPKWMQRSVTFINCGCAKLKCCVLCWRGIKRRCSCGKSSHAFGKKHEHADHKVNNVVETVGTSDEAVGCFMMCKRAKVANKACENEIATNTGENFVQFDSTENESEDKHAKTDAISRERKISSASETPKRRKSVQSRRDRRNSKLLERRASKSQERRKSIGTIRDIEIVSTDGSIDSLADLEEEVGWAEVGRICDTFFFLVFISGQAFFTVVFLVPLFTSSATPK